MSKNSQRKCDEEIQVFRRFAEKSHLDVVAESIEKRLPPEPDILCRLRNGANIAFELVEVCHPRNARFFGSAPLIAQAVERAYGDLPSELSGRFNKRFTNRPLSFTFVPRVSLNRIRQILPRVFLELIDQPEEEDGEFSAFSQAVRKSVMSVRLRGRVDVAGRPSFNIAGHFQSEDVVIDCLRPKLSRRYESLYAMELLAHFGGRAWGQSTKWKPPLVELLESVGMGSFRRVWVLGWKGIAFVYPSDLPH